jgi:hypothetical protein
MLKTCGQEDCKRKYYANGLCRYHYNLVRDPNTSTVCQADGCDTRTYKGADLCKKHRRRAAAHEGDPNFRYPTHCIVDECEAEAWARGLCPKHYQRWHVHGDPLVVLKHKGNGDTVPYSDKYAATHSRIRTARGRAADHGCVCCGQPAEEWCYVGGCPEEKQEEQRSGYVLSYCLHPSCYTPRCVRHHTAHDRGLTCSHCE